MAIKNPFGESAGKDAPKPSAKAEVTGGGKVKNPFGGGSSKKKGGLLSHVPTPITGLLGAVGSVLGMPQQVMYKAGQGLGDILTGHPGQGGRGLAGALGEILSVGQAGGDIGFSEALGEIDAEGKRVPKQLPKGVETAVNVVADPLNFVTFGAGAAAKAGLKTAKELGLAEKIAKGGLKSLTDVEQSTLRDALVAGSKAKNVEKSVDKTLRQLSVRGRGGITARIPGTGIGATVVSGKAAGKAADTIGLTAGKNAVKASGAGRLYRKAFVPGAGVADATGSVRASNELLEAISARSARQASDVDDTVTRWNAAVRDFEETSGREFTDAEDTFLSRALQSGDLEAAKAADPDMARLIDTGDAMRRGTDTQLHEAKVLADGQGRDMDTFMHRTRTPEAAKALGDEGADALYEGRSLTGSMTPGSAKARTIAPGSSEEEINRAIDLMQRGEDVPDGLLKDPARVAEYQAGVQRRIDDLEAQADEIRSQHLEPATGELTAAGKRRVAQLEGQAAVHKSIARQLKKRPAAAIRAGTRAAKASGKVDETTARLQKAADVRLIKDAEKRLATIKKQTERLTDKLAEKAKLADDDTRALVEAIAQKLPPGTPLYRESAVVSLIESGADAAKAVSTAQLLNDARGILDDAKKAILLSGDDVANGAKIPADWVSFDIPKMGTFHAHPEVKAELTKFMSVIGQDEAVGKFSKYLMQWERWWKGQVTASLPGGIPFALRNARSNVMLTWADGMPPSYFKAGLDFQLKVRKVVKTNSATIADEGVVPVMKRELGERDFEIWQAARDKGVLGDGFYNIDLSEAPTIRAAGAPKDGGKLKRGVRAVAGSHGSLAVRGRQGNQMVEQHARMSHFLYSIDRFGDLGQAAERTNTVLFDYGKLTSFEQKVVKRVLPFYTFMRKNVPGQFRALIENPARYTSVEKLSKAVSAPLPEGSPEYQQRQGAHVSRLPGIAGLITTPERPLQAAVNAIEPLAQLGAALAPGKQGAIEPAQGTPQAFRSLVSQIGGGPAAAAKALLEEGTGKSSFTGANLSAEERRQRLLATAYPALGRAPTLTGRLPSAIATQGRKNKAKTSSLAQVAAMLGIKLEPTDK